MRDAFTSLLLLMLLAALAAAVSCERADETRPFEPAVAGRPTYNAVCYGPHRDGQRPGGAQPSAAELLEDLRIMAPRWKLMRIYGASEFTDTLFAVMREHGIDMQVMLGVWIDPEEARNEAGEVLERFEEAAAKNRREVVDAIRLANAYPDIVAAVSVGNESQIFWSAHRSPLDILIGHVRRVRAGVDVPVTVADDFNYWNKPHSRELAAELDFITLHAHPMWNGLQVEEALAWQIAQLDTVRAMHPDRLVVIGETGWATSAIDEGQQGELITGTPGEAEQRFFYDAVRAWAEREREIVFFFEAFDENWKGGGNPAEVEKHWGLFRADRTPKAAMQRAAGD
ncbi:MAG: glycosyl hydrolase family 17 [Candidatus Krumholzibacteriota bacterium]|nr:glycosyl hydrolase family 17 [Candidatus Krumholzibacteriota bacterium]